MKTDEELVKEIKLGNEASTELIFSRYKPLVNSVARRYFLIGSELDDLVQEGMIGLYKATQSYSETQPATFKTFAYLCIKRQIQTAVKQASRLKHAMLNGYVSLDAQGGIRLTEESGEDEAVLILPSNKLSPDDTIVANETLKEMIEKIKNTLSSYEFKILNLYLKGNSYQTIAKMVGKDVKSVDNGLHRIKNKLAFLNC